MNTILTLLTGGIVLWYLGNFKREGLNFRAIPSQDIKSFSSRYSLKCKEKHNLSKSSYSPVKQSIKLFQLGKGYFGTLTTSIGNSIPRKLAKLSEKSPPNHIKYLATVYTNIKTET